MVMQTILTFNILGLLGQLGQDHLMLAHLGEWSPNLHSIHLRSGQYVYIYTYILYFYLNSRQKTIMFIYIYGVDFLHAIVCMLYIVYEMINLVLCWVCGYCKLFAQVIGRIRGWISNIEIVTDK